MPSSGEMQMDVGHIENPDLTVTLGGSLSGGETVFGRQDNINLLEVQAFYTANALDELPHEVLVDKITFAIVSDASGKIPQSMLMKILDVTLSSAMGALATSVRRGALGRLTVERADGTSILGTGDRSNALRQSLEAAGFIATPRGLRLRA